MRRRLRFTERAETDLLELYDFLAEKDLASANRARKLLRKAFELLTLFPFASRKAEAANDPMIRELVVPFGSAGYVVLFEIEDAQTVTVIAVRHQRESDYH